MKKKSLLALIVVVFIFSDSTFLSSAFGGYAHRLTAFAKRVESRKSEMAQLSGQPKLAGVIS